MEWKYKYFLNTKWLQIAFLKKKFWDTKEKLICLIYYNFLKKDYRVKYF